MRWISLINFCLIIAACTSSGAYFWVISNKEIPHSQDIAFPERKELPQNPFAQSKEAYEAIGQGPFSLKWVAPKMQLPDLRSEILFSGKNSRPDVTPNSPLYHLTLKESGESTCARTKEKIYLVYQGSLQKPAELQAAPKTPGLRPIIHEPKHMSAKGLYTLSRQNRPTPLWVEALPISEQSIQLTVHMLDDRGQQVLSPPELRSFSIPLTEQKHLPQSWDLDGTRVDTTLLVRQRARWVGPDLFMEMHGGEEFSNIIGRERIDFLDGDTLYSCFVNAGSFLIWEDKRWKEAPSGLSTAGRPLLVVKNIDEKVMQFELWDSEGRAKFPLSLIKTKDHNALPNIEDHFKFVGAKSWGQFIVECQSKRLILKPKDWLVLSQEGWQRIDSADEVDAYVNQRLTGPLLILDKISKQNGRSALIGHLFNTARTEVHDVELPVTQTPLVQHYNTMEFPPLMRPEIFKPVEEDVE